MPTPQIADALTAKQHLKQGIDTLVDLLAPTLGPVGRFVAHQQYQHRSPEILDDAATIVRRILSLGNPQQDIGAMLIRNLIWRVGQQVGDGGKTTALLAQAMYQQGLRLVAAGANPVQMTEGMKAAVHQAVKAIDAQARPISHEDDLAALALTTTHNPTLAAILGEMRQLLGAEGYILIEDYVAPYLERQYIRGASYPAQIASPYLYTQASQKQALLTETALALVEAPLTELDQAIGLLEAAVQKGVKRLAIVAPAFGKAALGVLVANQQAAPDKLAVIAAKLELVGDEQRYALQDMALLTGATLLGEPHERSATDAQPSDFGQANRVEIGQRRLVVVPPPQTNPLVQAEMKTLRQRLAELSLDETSRPLLTQRLAALSGGVGLLKIGASSKSERTLLNSQATKALKLLSIAQRSGVVAGGGAALCHAQTALQSLQLTGEAALGLQIVAESLTVPSKRIMQNAGFDETARLIHQLRQAGWPTTFDVRQGRLVDAHVAGPLDAAEVVITALRTAVSGAMMALTTEAIVYHRDPKKSFQP